MRHMTCQRYTYAGFLLLVVMLGVVWIYLPTHVILNNEKDIIRDDIGFQLKTIPGKEECDETMYDFGPKSEDHTIFTDPDLWTRCGINDTFRMAPEAIRSHPLPQLHLKCGPVNGTLLSTRVVPRTFQPGFLVPNIVHYVLIGDRFSFLNYISLKSVDRFLKPHHIFVHGNGLTTGEWWTRALQEVPNIYHIHWPWFGINSYRPGRVSPKHMSDVMRMYAIQGNGGIYLDTDVIVLKSFDPLRPDYPLTLPRGSAITLAPGIIISAQHRPFICVWGNGYRDFNLSRPQATGWYAMHTPHQLQKLLPVQIHVEEEKLLHPAWTKEEPLMFRESYDWSSYYTVHVWKKLSPLKVPDGPGDIVSLNTTLGEVFRYIYNDISER